MGLSDTHPGVEAKHIELIRSLEPGRKAELMSAFSWDLIVASRRLIADQHPEWSNEEVMLHWAEIHYGKQLIDRVRAFLRRRPASSET